jgi:hypothetical protein
MMGPARLKSVPKEMLPVYEKIVGLIDDVCDRHLDSEYRDLARTMTAALYPSRSERAIMNAKGAEGVI